MCRGPGPSRRSTLRPDVLAADDRCERSSICCKVLGEALGYEPTPPLQPESTWLSHCRARLGDEPGFLDRIFDPAGTGPVLWFQQVPEAKAGKNRLHLDVYPTGRDDSTPLASRIRMVDAKVAELVDAGAVVDHVTRDDNPNDPVYYVVMDPEGNEFCVS